MENLLVRDIYTVDTISKGNSKAWVKLMEVMATKEPNTEVTFDFKGINVVEPWTTPEFQQFMQDERVYLRFWSSENTVNTINIMCTLNGIKSGRAINEVVEVQREPTQEELKIAAMAKQLQSYFTVIDGKTVLEVFKRFDQIGVPITVKYIEEAMKMYASTTHPTAIHLETKGITIQSSVIEYLTNLIKTMSDIGVNLTIHSDNTEVMNKVGIYQSIADSNVCSDRDKLRLIKAKLHVGKVGMLIRYMESKGKDEFGRKGKGKPVSCRVAIYKGIQKIKDQFVLTFTTFNGNTFYTRTHWSLEHDNDVLKGLDVKDEVIKLGDFGMYNDFLGSYFHFIAPIQVHKKDSTTMYGVDEFGKVTYTKMTIPERIKVVFEDWGIEHDSESLQTYIDETRELLSKQD